ncbi:cytochrome c oxidase assembly protein [Georgenia sp. MJ206]|uniref:cytochrome c oxidase assembly protein n=1 Tax=Georgenia wangjunii TaxID=3117730 RepID=UPI002F265BBE
MTIGIGAAVRTSADHAAHAAGAGSGLAAWLVPALLALALLAAYGAGARAYRRRRGRPWDPRRTASWVLGALLVAAAVSPPASAWAHADPRGHMAQHLVLGMYAPLALVLAAPVSLLLGASEPPTARRVTAVLRLRGVHVLSHPGVAAVLATGSLFVLYLTPLYALTLTEPVVHTALNVHLVLAGALYTWAIAGPDPAPRRPGMGVRVGVLLLSAGAHAFLAKLLYARAGDPAGEAAAQWMYYGGDVAELLLATALFAWWYEYRPGQARRSRATRKPAPST